MGVGSRKCVEIMQRTILSMTKLAQKDGTQSKMLVLGRKCRGILGGDVSPERRNKRVSERMEGKGQ